MTSPELPRHVFGPTGVRVPKVGLGTWYLEESDAKTAIAAVRAAIDLGLTHVDTAELYGSGQAESLVGQALEGRRQDVFLVSKVIPSNASRKGTVKHCEQTLQRLRTDHLDCYLLHWPGSHPLEDTIAAFEELVQAGKTRAWGVSNFDETELAEALAIAGPGRIACNQVLYHLEERGIEHAVLPWCEKNNVAVVGYTPYGQHRQYPPRGPAGATLQQIAERHGATARQVALAFLTRRPDLFAIPKSTNPEHLRENADGARLELTVAEIAAVERAFPLGKRRRGVAML
jgi:diketogulonate reductase-like aldo/keto reductase